jgi:FkbM family methyltransferase
MRYPTLHQSLSFFRDIAPQSCQSVIDIGVQYETTFLVEVFPDSYHYLFEPVSLYFDSIHSNYTKRHIDYELNEIALSDQDGSLYLHKKSMDGTGRITHSEIHPDRKPDLESLVEIEEIETSTLDRVMAAKELRKNSYVIKMDVDGEEERIIAAGSQVISNASLIIIECSLMRRNLLSRAELLERHGFRLWDICDNAYYFGQLSQVDLVFINEEIRARDIRFRPWEYSAGKVVWDRWQHGFEDLGADSISNPFSEVGTASEPEKCNICGCQVFVAGPLGRTSLGGELPQCQECGSLERHRIIRAAWEKIPRKYLSHQSVLQFSYDTSVDASWFSDLEIPVSGSSSSLDIPAIDRASESYDVVVCNHVLQHVEDDRRAFGELMRVLKADGFLQLTVPKPNEIENTDDWGYPDENLHGHFRHYGLDLIERFNAVYPAVQLIYIKSSDAVTGSEDCVFFWSKSLETISFLRSNLELHFKVMS